MWLSTLAMQTTQHTKCALIFIVVDTSITSTPTNLCSRNKMAFLTHVDFLGTHSGSSAAYLYVSHMADSTKRGRLHRAEKLTQQALVMWDDMLLT